MYLRYCWYVAGWSKDFDRVLKAEKFLNENAELKDGQALNKNSKRHIKACILMHTFGTPSKIEEISDICKKWNDTPMELLKSRVCCGWSTMLKS